MAITNHERVGKTHSMRRRARDTGIRLMPDRDAESKAQSSRSGFHGAVTLDATRVGRDASRIADEVVAHLSGLVGAKVTVTLEELRGAGCP